MANGVIIPTKIDHVKTLVLGTLSTTSTATAFSINPNDVEGMALIGVTIVNSGGTYYTGALDARVSYCYMGSSKTSVTINMTNLDFAGNTVYGHFIG